MFTIEQCNEIIQANARSCQEKISEERRNSPDFVGMCIVCMITFPMVAFVIGEFVNMYIEYKFRLEELNMKKNELVIEKLKDPKIIENLKDMKIIEIQKSENGKMLPVLYVYEVFFLFILIHLFYHYVSTPIISVPEGYVLESQSRLE